MAGKTDIKIEIRDAQRAWLREVTRKMGESVSQLANNAGVSDVTLTRFLNREDHRGTLSSLTIQQIKRYTGLPGPSEVAGTARAGFSEGEQVELRSADLERPVIATMLKAALAGRPNAAPWRLATSALEAIGFYQGDILISDAAVTPKNGDVVVAQMIDLRTGAAETIFRVYQSPYLVGLDAATRQPLPIDNERITVVGVVTETIRGRAP